jgi:hypothetical protein
MNETVFKLVKAMKQNKVPLDGRLTIKAENMAKPAVYSQKDMTLKDEGEIDEYLAEKIPFNIIFCVGNGRKLIYSTEDHKSNLWKLEGVVSNGLWRRPNYCPRHGYPTEINISI